MGISDNRGVTALLAAANGGDPDAFSHLVVAVYEDLHGIASNEMKSRFGGQARSLTLCPTALVSSVVQELLSQRKPLQNGEHFFALATRLMTRWAINYQRQRLAQKRGRGQRGRSLENCESIADNNDNNIRPDVLVALNALHEIAPRQAEVVTLHVGCSLPLPRVAELMQLSLATVERDWTFARSWMASRLEPGAR